MFSMKSAAISMTLAVCCVATGPRVAASQLDRAYVVFGGQIAEVDVTHGRLLKRLDYIDKLRPALNVSLGPTERVLRLRGSSAQGGCRQVCISLPGLKPIVSSRLRVALDDLIGSGDQVHPPHPPEIKIKRIRPARLEKSPSRLRLAVCDSTLAGDGRELLLEGRVSATPCGELSDWTLSLDRRRLLVVTSGGFKTQSYLSL